MKYSFYTLITLIIIFCFTGKSNAQFSQAEISSRLLTNLKLSKSDDHIKVLVLLKDRVDIKALDNNLYASNATIQQRSVAVISALMLKAKSTQGPILDYLNEKSLTGKVVFYDSYWITNLIAVDATPDVIYEIASRPDVDEIDLDAVLDYDRPVSSYPTNENIESSEIGLRVINAHLLWQLGITGAGRLVMNIDTGVDKNHPALSYKWRGNTVPWYHAWLDKNGATQQPTDCDVHGTHTMGIMCGRSPAGDTIGVAPDAQWIASRTICSSPHTSNSIAAFQWAMNPDSNINTTNDIPDAIGNSWYDPDVTNECSSIYVSTLNACEAIGIAVVFSCGNNGPGTSTITKPKNINTNIVNAFCVGNVDANQPFPYPIASTSSRGPSLCGGVGSLLIKPEVVAPGSNVRSSVPGGGYSLLSGTSMSCPHIVGAVALLRQYAPNLTGRQILEALYNTATDLGPAGEDNDYGKGIINVFAAYQSLGPAITHTPLPNTENTAGPYTVNCVITPAGSPIVPANTKLFWSRNNANITDSLLLINTSGNNWTGNIPGNNTNSTYRYYIKTADQLGRITTAPSGAPGNLYLFLAQVDVTPPVITHTQLPDQPKATWPATVNCSVVDNSPQDFGPPDSVWVRWKIGTAGTTRHFKLINTSGNSYSAAFNSVQADVNPGDVIYYRIIAQGSGSLHLKDSTAQLNFTITSVVNACVGTGTTAVGYPYYTFYMDSRCDMLYTAAEMTAAGLAPGNITKIGFNVASVGSPAMNGFNIKVQNTALTTISGFTSSGWTTCYSGTYTPPGTGIQYVTLTTPFAWNGTSNILIEICFNNSAWSSNSTVLGTAVTGRTLHQYQDLSAGNGCVDLIAGTLQSTRPNVCMEINTIVGQGQQNTELPKSFSLAQNYPNPFNPSTTIKYEVPKQSFVKLIVYDVLGREVATLVNTVKNAGRYEANFDASVLSSGVYFYRMVADSYGESGEFIDVKKMLLIK
jgi:hypothetical protein